MKVKRTVPLSQALDEISTMVERLRKDSPARLDGYEIEPGDEVTLEIETESGKKGGELEFEIKWQKGKARSRGRRRWFVWVLVGAAFGAGALIFARQRNRRNEYDQEFTDAA